MTPSKPAFTTREICLYALLGALLIAVQVALAVIPNVELVSLLVIVYATALGWRSLVPLAVFVLAEGLIYGFGLWWINYLYVWLAPTLAAQLFRKQNSFLFWGLFSGFFGLAFGALCAIPYFFIGGPSMAFSYWISGLPFDLIHGVSNLIVGLALYKPARWVLEKGLRAMRP